MRARATALDISGVCARIENLGFRPHIMPGSQRTVVGITGNPGLIDSAEFEDLPGFVDAIPVSKAYKLVSREIKPDNTDGDSLALCGGPCSVESREQILAAARAVKAAGAQLLRGGAYKPRTSPYAFQGLAEEGLKLLAEARAETGLGIVTEAVDVETFDLVEKYGDCIQIGGRNMQNFSLLRRAGRCRLPVLLKRGISSTLEEFLMAAEYVLSEGNYQVILCERGVRTFADHTRNTLDLSIVPSVSKAEPSAHRSRPEPWNRQARQSASHGARGRGVGRIRTAGGGASESGQSAVRWGPVAVSRAVHGVGGRVPRGV